MDGGKWFFSTRYHKCRRLKFNDPVTGEEQDHKNTDTKGFIWKLTYSVKPKIIRIISPELKLTIIVALNLLFLSNISQILDGSVVCKGPSYVPQGEHDSVTLNPIH